MAKLHEGLAIHKDRVGVVKRVLEEARGVFKSAAHYHGFTKRVEFIDADDERFNQTEEKKIDETVPSKLDYVNGHLRALLDLDYQIEQANQNAVGTLTVGGIEVADVPVGFLLTIENKFKEYRAALEMIPTHAPGIPWIVDTEQSSAGDIFRSRTEDVSWLTKKKPVYTVVVDATQHHPAQVKESHDDVRVAKVTMSRLTATISPAQKSDMLARCDAIIQAAKRARQRANDVEISETRIAEPLLHYIVHGSPEPPSTTRS